MIEKRYGRIINIGSFLRSWGCFEVAAYGARKSAVIPHQTLAIDGRLGRLCQRPRAGRLAPRLESSAAEGTERGGSS